MFIHRSEVEERPIVVEGPRGGLDTIPDLDMEIWMEMLREVAEPGPASEKPTGVPNGSLPLDSRPPPPPRRSIRPPVPPALLARRTPGPPLPRNEDE